MNVAFDTNIVLDAILEREGSECAQQLFIAVADEKIAGIISANTVTDIYYVARKAIGDANARQAIREILFILDVAPVNGETCMAALQLPFSDFEDAVLATSVSDFGADIIVTRDRDFINATESPTPVMLPDDALDII